MKQSSSTSEDDPARADTRADSALGGPLLGPLFESADVSRPLSDRSLLRALLLAEQKLAEACTACGLIPDDARDAIVRVTSDPGRAGIDERSLGLAAVHAGNPVPALVAGLAAALPADTDRWVHLGATSQDILDTALALCLRDALSALERAAKAATRRLADVARDHRDTVMVARTLGQHAVPTTFGLVSAGWLVALDAATDAVEAAAAALPVSLGGAGGTLAAYGDSGTRVATAYAGFCGLAPPGPLPWHTDRRPWLGVADACARAATACAKIAADVLAMTSTDVGELRIAGGGSSAMPHKQNPVDAVLVRADAMRVPGLVSTLLTASVHDGQRATGAWHAEWQTLRELVSVTGGAVARTDAMLATLEVDTVRMSGNLAVTGGAVMTESLVASLLPALGRTSAQAVVARLTAEAATAGRQLADVARSDAEVRSVLDDDAVLAAMNPVGWLGSAGAMVDAAVGTYLARSDR